MNYASDFPHSFQEELANNKRAKKAKQLKAVAKMFQQL